LHQETDVGRAETFVADSAASHSRRASAGVRHATVCHLRAIRRGQCRSRTELRDGISSAPRRKRARSSVKPR